MGSTLLDRAKEGREEPVTLVGMSVSNLTTNSHVQLELAVDEGDVLRAGSSEDLRRRALDMSVDEVRERFGRTLVKYGNTPERGVVSEEFRK